MFLTKEAVDETAVAVACNGCPPGRDISGALLRLVRLGGNHDVIGNVAEKAVSATAGRGMTWETRNTSG
jgi:hypothetical protein